MTRLLIVQHAGDFREAWRRREVDGTETYFAHGYLLDQLGRLAHEFDDVAILCCSAPSYEERLPNGALTMGAASDAERNPGPAIEAMERFDPTHLIVLGPMRAQIRWGIRRGIQVGCMFADSFFGNPLVRWLRYGWVAGVLNDPAVGLVANHGVNAARGLVQRGVSASKVMVWDFPHDRTPDQLPAKTARRGRACDLLYVGSIIPSKGVGDLIAAGARLRGRRDLRIRIAGAGQIDRFRRQSEKLGIAGCVEFLGLVANAEIRAMMRAADAVIVPSRHRFPEGLPFVLFEAMESRTPTIASDHPMFRGHLVDGESALIYPAGDSAALAHRIETLLGDPELYARISRNTAQAWHRMQTRAKWGEIIERWVRGMPDDRSWLQANTLAAIDRGSRA